MTSQSHFVWVLHYAERLQPTVGTYAAARYLFLRGVPIEYALRALVSK